MNNHNQRPVKGDPSEISQVFPKYEIQIHCCRYWWLQNWEFNDLSFPFWRIYHNNFEGAAIVYNNMEIPITPDKLILIAPNTPYSTYLYNHRIPQSGYTLKGGRVSQMLPLKDKYLLHLFIHFNLGIPYDNAVPGVYSLPANNELNAILIKIKKYLNYENSKFSFNSTLAINTIINHLLSSIPENSWENITTDNRIIDVIKHIENHLTDDLTNPQLAAITNIATNSFTRLFTKESGISPQKYVKKKRIDKACIMLHHTSLTIEEIATASGFADRYHFTRIFSQITGYSPVKYKKRFTLK